MLPSARISPYEDARQKVALIEPHGKVVLDCCAGLGYFAAWCLEGSAARVISFEKNADVIWLREMNPWSPQADARLTLTHGDIHQAIAEMPGRSVDAVLHDPPRFSLAGELYAQSFYDQLARVLKKKGRLFHYTGSPNKLSRGRDLANEVMKRLQIAGFTPRKHGDGVLAIRD
jgi:predicted methyltransferase